MGFSLCRSSNGESAVYLHADAGNVFGVFADQHMPDAQVRHGASCPVLALRHACRDGQGAPGWALILPGGWMGPFWQALAYQGVRPTGQREWRWVAAYQVSCRPRCRPKIPYLIIAIFAFCCFAWGALWCLMSCQRGGRSSV